MVPYEAFYDSTDFRLRENVVIRIKELALLALHQVIPFRETVCKNLCGTDKKLCTTIFEAIFNYVRPDASGIVYELVIELTCIVG